EHADRGRVQRVSNTTVWARVHQLVILVNGERVAMETPEMPAC
ncbi:MAG: hypothetical protein RLZZ623_417, partial [Actinomycetota bacterium]